MLCRLPMCASFALLAAVAGTATADTLYSQPFAQTANGGYFASSQASYDQFDSFVLSADGSIESVSWYGVDLNELINLSPINPLSFLVEIWSDADGLPGEVLSSTTIEDSAGATDTGQQLMGLTLYSYAGSLSAPFTATAGTTYWIKIIDPTSNNDWFWASASGPDNTHVAIIGGVAGTFSDDLSFTLTGTELCAADFNGDGFLDFFDFTDFVTCFEGGACPDGKTADFNNDGFADFFDFSDFVTAFETGC